MTDKRTDAEILSPDRDVTLSDGRVVRVRELSYGESLALQGRAGAREFISQAHAMTAPGEAPDHMAIIALGAEHPAWWLAFLSSSTGLPPDELVGLRPLDGAMLALAAVAGNGGFFAVAVTTHRPLTAPTASPSPTPSPSSSDTDTATPAA